MRLGFPVRREVPRTILAALRAVDPRTAVLWWGAGLHTREEAVPGRAWAARPVSRIEPAWLVGIVDPYRVGNAVAGARCRLYQRASLVVDKWEQPAEFLVRAKRFRDRQALAQLAYQGFVPKFFWFARDLDSELVFAYQEMAWFAQNLFETAQRAMLQQDDTADDPVLIERQRLIREAVQAQMPDIWRHTFRGRRSVLVPAKVA